MENLHVNDQVKFLTNCLVNIFKNFVPNKTIVCKDKDPPWMTEEIKRACLDKPKAYKRYVKNSRTNIDQLSLHKFASNSENLISDAKTVLGKK